VETIKCSHCGRDIRKDKNKLVVDNEEYKLCGKCSTILLRFVKNKNLDEIPITTKNRSIYKIQDYGEERIRHEYCVEGLTTSEIALKIGISQSSLSKYIRQNGFKRSNKREVSDSESDKESHTCGVV
jgi:hypothetical protein